MARFCLYSEWEPKWNTPLGNSGCATENLKTTEIYGKQANKNKKRLHM